MERQGKLSIVVAGVCGSGKSTLVKGLRAQGFEARAVAQEHSLVPTMWLMTKPDLLIYLEADLATIKRRRQISWGQSRYEEQLRRLAHAREHSALQIKTDDLCVDEVLKTAIDFLEEDNGIHDNLRADQVQCCH